MLPFTYLVATALVISTVSAAPTTAPRPVIRAVATHFAEAEEQGRELAAVGKRGIACSFPDIGGEDAERANTDSTGYSSWGKSCPNAETWARPADGHTGTNTGKGLAAKKPCGGERGESFRSRIIGAWELVDYHAYAESDPSDKIYPMGRDCQGIILYTPDGYMSAQLQTPGQPHFAQNDLSGGTQEELAEAGKNYLAYTGPFYVDESGEQPILRHHMSVSSFPNWLGNTQRRLVKITEENGDKYLNLAPDGAIDVGGEKRVPNLKWRRLPDNQASSD